MLTAGGAELRSQREWLTPPPSPRTRHEPTPIAAASSQTTAGFRYGTFGQAELRATAGGMSRGDLKELGELLDEGDSGLLIVAAQDTEARLDEAIKHGNKIVKKQLRSDEKDLEAALDEAIKESNKESKN